ncbi:MAG: hypothetical protein IPK27_09095 [Rhodanobacteraceae bacterium]|nr:hypothetical protein [Rhodanobacteraceae bacterium]
MLSGVDSELLGFCEPWLAREPRLLFACQFAAEGAGRARFLAAQVLARELAQTLLAISERRVAEARLMWWSDEASYWLQGHPRHPLALGLDAATAAPGLAQWVQQVHAWMEAPPESQDELRARLRALAATGDASPALADSGDDAVWLGLAARQALVGAATGGALLPLDVCARHSLRRSQWPELDPARRRSLLAEVSTGMAPAREARGAAPAALAALEQRWLARIGDSGDERLRLFDVFAAWRAARRAR